MRRLQTGLVWMAWAAWMVTSGVPAGFAQDPGPYVTTAPMQPNMADSAEERWQSKPVLASRPLDGMESLAAWSFKGNGTMALDATEVKDGQHSLRIASRWNAAEVNGDGEWLDLLATRRFASEDWTGYNRISLWVYPDVAGAPAVTISMILHNEGKHILPDAANEGRDESIPVKNHQWNHVVWEIAPLDREKITALDIGYSLPKMIPDVGDRNVLYLDKLDLERVTPDHVEGWDVAEGKIAFSHEGYGSASPKKAFASDLQASEFTVVRANDDAEVLRGPVQRVATSLGTYQVMDFSRLHAPGAYRLRAGAVTTKPFAIGDDIWRDSIWKELNFMYAERCGTVIPGIHGICHQDDYTTHDSKRVSVNGGYHDAGDLSATGNITEMTYANLAMAERLHATGQDPALEKRVREEAEWGLHWILKTSFHDGFRSTGQLISYWTDNIMGDADDRFGEAVNDPEWNFRVAAVEALAARVFADTDPDLASRSLATAREDWQFAVKGLQNAKPLPETYGQKDQLELDSFGTIASVDLYRATHEAQYSDEAHTLARNILASQERALQTDWSIPMTGYFYTGPARKNLFHRFHIGQEEEPIVALASLCDSFPDDKEWMDWYSAVVLHSKYYQEVAAKADAPFDMLPASVYRVSEAGELSGGGDWRQLRSADAGAFVDEVKQGVPLGGDAYLRRFPVWFNFRGNSSVLLSSAKALSAAAHLRHDVDAAELAQEQAEWMLGRNPFSTSMMYGEGYDWTPLYSVRSGQLVGAFPVGMETKGVSDAPYWPTQICWTYKEVWSQPSGEWIWLMQDLSGPAVVKLHGSAAERATFTDTLTGWSTTATGPEVRLPQGRYKVAGGGTQSTLDVLAGERYSLDLSSAADAGFGFHADAAKGKHVTLRIAGGGAAQLFAVRVSNLRLESAATQSATAGGEVVWQAQVLDEKTPWIAVAYRQGALATRREVSGIVGKQ